MFFFGKKSSSAPAETEQKVATVQPSTTLHYSVDSISDVMGFLDWFGNILLHNDEVTVTQFCLLDYSNGLNVINIAIEDVRDNLPLHLAGYAIGLISFGLEYEGGKYTVGVDINGGWTISLSTDRDHVNELPDLARVIDLDD